MAIKVRFDYPAPVQQPRPVAAELHPVIQINLTENTVQGVYYEYFENKVQGEPPVQRPDQRPFTINVTDQVIGQILQLLAVPAIEQGILVSGSLPTVTQE